MSTTTARTAGRGVQSVTGLPPVPDLGEGEGNPRCMWDWDVCPETPTKKIVWRGNNGTENYAETLCARHYAVELSRFTEVHSVSCSGTVASHILALGDM
ncbi:hypothetical protein [Nesterenkonia alkaliphila]|uniref:Uncharacterized protein n=1 Tax=Nesterenkonia alkaliphila TaxID=1463631 RepID=A0A7K1UGX3_9MICC|nr:hypothetical protein [Nesterenkonia alkaliphila]MVT25689.1 hypothetical protein [Nesterenkonia alkaliphila]GFZ85115.1 hypothetical protein GCM10011359_12750 [Nesterenkonia alkaliphila]